MTLLSQTKPALGPEREQNVKVICPVFSAAPCIAAQHEADIAALMLAVVRPKPEKKTANPKATEKQKQSIRLAHKKIREEFCARLDGIEEMAQFGTTSKEVAAKFLVSRNTAERGLRRLFNDGRLRRGLVTQGKHRFFVYYWPTEKRRA